jgi:hypothetical protein
VIDQLIQGLFSILVILVLPLFGFVLLVVSIVREIAGRRSFRTSLVIVAVSAASFYVWDAFGFMFIPLSAMLLFAVAVVCFLPATLMALRTDRRVAMCRAAMTGIYLFAAVASVVTIGLQNHMADHRAVKLGDACLAYRAKYHHYPKDLEALVPEFIPSVPVPRYSVVPDRFTYFARSSDSTAGSVSDDLQKEPLLYYQVVPPFGRRFYHMESRDWGFLD